MPHQPEMVLIAHKAVSSFKLPHLSETKFQDTLHDQTCINTLPSADNESRHPLHNIKVKIQNKDQWTILRNELIRSLSFAFMIVFQQVLTRTLSRTFRQASLSSLRILFVLTRLAHASAVQIMPRSPLGSWLRFCTSRNRKETQKMCRRGLSQSTCRIFEAPRTQSSLRRL